MNQIISPALILILFASSSSAEAQAPSDGPAAIFLPIKAGEKADDERKEAVAAVNLIVLQEFQARLGKSVLSLSDLKSAGDLGDLCAYFGCDDSTNADSSALIAKYLERVPMKLTGHLSKTASNYVLSLDLVQSSTLKSNRSTESNIPLSDAALGFGAKVAVARLFKQEVPTPNHFLRAWVPGFAQIAKDQKRKGGLIIIGEIALIAGGGIAMFMESEKRNELRSQNTLSALLPSIRKDAERLQLLAVSAFISAGALYAYNVLDGMFSRDEVHYTLYE